MTLGEESERASIYCLLFASLRTDYCSSLGFCCSTTALSLSLSARINMHGDIQALDLFSHEQARGMRMR